MTGWRRKLRPRHLRLLAQPKGPHLVRALSIAAYLDPLPPLTPEQERQFAEEQRQNLARDWFALYGTEPTEDEMRQVLEYERPWPYPDDES